MLHIFSSNELKMNSLLNYNSLGSPDEYKLLVLDSTDEEIKLQSIQSQKIEWKIIT